MTRPGGWLGPPGAAGLWDCSCSYYTKPAAEVALAVLRRVPKERTQFGYVNRPDILALWLHPNDRAGLAKEPVPYYRGAPFLDEETLVSAGFAAQETIVVSHNHPSGLPIPVQPDRSHRVLGAPPLFRLDGQPVGTPVCRRGNRSSQGSPPHAPRAQCTIDPEDC